MVARYSQRSEPLAVESISRANAISRSKLFSLRNGSEIGTLRGENPLRPSFVLLGWHRWNFQLNELGRSWLVADPGVRHLF